MLLTSDYILLNMFQINTVCGGFDTIHITGYLLINKKRIKKK